MMSSDFDTLSYEFSLQCCELGAIFVPVLPGRELRHRIYGWTMVGPHMATELGPTTL